MAKRGLCILLAVLTLFALAVPAFAAEETPSSGLCGDDVEWSLSGGTLTISGKGDIAEYAWGGMPWNGVKDQIKKVVIKPGVTGISSYAFESCPNLTGVTLPDGLTRIGLGAFQSCGSLTGVTVPASVAVISPGAFNTLAMKAINVAEGNEHYSSVDGVLFNADKTELLCYPCGKAAASYAVPDTVERIGAQAFINANITTLTIPAGVTGIGDSALMASLSEIAVEKGNKNYASVDGVLFNADKTELIRFPTGKNISAYTIPDTVVSIAEKAFYGCNLTEVTIPASVTGIGDQAFTHSARLTGVTVPASVTGIAFRAFGGCNVLTGITILNPACDIESEDSATLGVPGTTVVYGYAGSTAETYAKKHGYTFKSPDEAPGEDTELAVPAVKIAQTDSGIKVTWNAVKGSPLYMVYYKENGGGWKKIGSTAKTAYTWKKAKAGATYQFAVRCCDSDKKTLLSSYKASNKVKYTVELDAPTVTIAQTKSGVQVTWSAVKGSPLYMVYYKENGGGWKKIGTTSETSYTRKASKLKNGATYQFAVRCCDSDKKTLLSSYKASNKVKYTVELDVPAVTIAQTKSGIQVTWGAVKGSPRYMVYYKENGGSWKKIGSTAKTAYTWKKAKAGATYQFAVRCCDSDKATLLSGYQASNKLKYEK